MSAEGTDVRSLEICCEDFGRPEESAEVDRLVGADAAWKESGKDSELRSFEAASFYSPSFPNRFRDLIDGKD